MSKIIKNYLARRVLSRTVILIIDTLIIIFSCFTMYLIRYGFDGFTFEVGRDGTLLCVILVFFNSIAFVLNRTFRGVLRFSSFTDILRIVYSLFIGYTGTLIVLLILKRFNGLLYFSTHVFISIYFLNTFLMIFSRIIVKEVYEAITEANIKPVNVFIYGTKHSAINVARAFKGNKDFKYRVMGFISDEAHMIGKEIMGVTVHENNDDLFSVLESKDVKTIIVSPHKMEEIKNSTLLSNFVDHDISLLTTIPVSEWNGSLNSKEQIKDIQIEDLLPRDPIKINMLNIAANIQGKRVMVTGAAGSIGSEIVRQVAAFNPNSIILIDQAETPLHDLYLELNDRWKLLRAEIVVANVNNYSRMEKIFSRTRPQIIFHAAAYKHVPMMEVNVSEAIQTNILGTKLMADLAVKFNANKFVMVSTDKAVNPSNVMGCSKRICEIYVQSLAKHIENGNDQRTQFITTRFGNVLGSNGSVIPLFKEQIKNGGPVTVTHPEIIRYFMTIPEACQLVLEAGSMGKGGEIFIFDMGKPVKILDLAKRMIKLSGTTNVKIEFTGLRNGEKLYEELLNQAEHTKPTHHEKIMIADVREYVYEEVSQLIDSLIKSSYEYDDMTTVRKMKEIVPEFQSINSPFEAVDNILEKISKES